MSPLDLSKAPPRAPRAELAGVIFLPRSIDKIRATLPGGNLGPYAIAGFTQTMLEMLGITTEDFTARVAAAMDDSAIAAFVADSTTEHDRSRWRTFVSARQPRGGNREEAFVAYPWLKDRPDLVLALDVLTEDDRQIFT